MAIGGLLRVFQTYFKYVGTGQYFARVKVRGKLIRRKLDINVSRTAKLTLGDFLKRGEITAAIASTALRQRVSELIPNTARENRQQSGRPTRE